jgi:nucleotide-binding universal stress UspA family protein
MYRHILIPTDGSELADKAVVHGLSLAKSVGAKITALVVEPTFNVYDVPSSKMFRMTEAFAEYAEHAKAHACWHIDWCSRCCEVQSCAVRDNPDDS